MHFLTSSSLALLLLTFLAMTADAHTWVEQLMAIAPNGTFVGSPGYPRGNVLRSSPGFGDPSMSYLISNDGKNLSYILPSSKMCKDTQQKQVQSEGSPRLQASPGAAIALRYQENGHVTLPETQAGKPHNRGTVYVYGTTEPKEGELLADIHNVWNKDGTGGDRRGVLLSEQAFDDEQCYQVNGGRISTDRQAKFPHESDQLMGADLWCQTDIALPSNAPSGKPYTLYWVWDWPTAPGADPSLPKGKQEIYTTCMDVDIVDTPKTQIRIAESYIDDQPLNNAAVKARFVMLSGEGPQRETVTPTPTSSQVAKSTSFTTVTKTADCIHRKHSRSWH